MNKNWTYEQALQAMQAGVGWELRLLMEKNPRELTPEVVRQLKHLRVGINARACDHTALVKLLIAAGVISEPQYLEALRQEMLLEVMRYEDELTRQNGGVPFLLDIPPGT